MESLKISVSILSADFSKIGCEVKELSRAGADMIHLDVMDGTFVPNITFGPKLIKSIRDKSNLLFDTHLMISNPQEYIESFAEAGSDYITVHLEAVTHMHKLISKIKTLGKKVGVSIVPSTNESTLKYIIEEVDLILVMTVNPGFGGQQFIKSQLDKIQSIANMVKNIKPDVIVSVDGGINDITAKLCRKAGANMLVSGEYVFSGLNYKSRIDILKDI